MLKTAQIINILQNGGVGVLPTDTIYGVVGSALKKSAVERIYKLRRRNPKKPMIILIGSMGDLRLFGIKPNRATKKILKKLWPGKVSVILATSDMRQATWRKKWKYLHRGTNALAFRLPAIALAKAGLPTNFNLRRLLQITGPLVAPSANWEGEPPAKTIREAERYFKKHVDFYVDAGRLDSPPSTLVKMEKGRVVVLRKGVGNI